MGLCLTRSMLTLIRLAATGYALRYLQWAWKRGIQTCKHTITCSCKTWEDNALKWLRWWGGLKEEWMFWTETVNEKTSKLHHYNYCYLYYWYYCILEIGLDSRTSSLRCKTRRGSRSHGENSDGRKQPSQPNQSRLEESIAEQFQKLSVRLEFFIGIRDSELYVFWNTCRCWIWCEIFSWKYRRLRSRFDKFFVDVIAKKLVMDEDASLPERTLLLCSRYFWSTA